MRNTGEFFICIWYLELQKYIYIFFNSRPHLWHFQQASSWTLRSQPCPNHDWWCQHLVARRSCIPKETRNVITFPPIVTLIYFKKTFNHLSQTKTAATIKKLKRKMKEHLKSMRKSHDLFCHWYEKYYLSVLKRKQLTS